MRSDPNAKVLNKLATRVEQFREKVGNEVWQAALKEVADLYNRFEQGHYYSAGGTVTRIGPSADGYVRWKAAKWGFMERGWANGTLGFAIERAAMLRREPMGFRVDWSRVQRIRHYVKHFIGMKAPGLGNFRKGWRSRIAKKVSAKLAGEINSIGELGQKIGKKPQIKLTLDHIVQNFSGPAVALANGRRTRGR